MPSIMQFRTRRAFFMELLILSLFSSCWLLIIPVSILSNLAIVIFKIRINYVKI
ncbi:hypothetical protein HanPSC8_Chr11g0462541 [Helianthus annuus]|nr:hypothetical protein HanPSC8_Chr11g0462541 [Helianthus annuus]